MYLKKLTEKRLITIDYYSNGALATFRGRISGLNLIEQILSLRDEKQNSLTLHLSEIISIH
ncbi:YolD-like family protein [Falsibacillus albus]|uniref:YolD-like family protein n=1 Tax=Falsibacillus albus TaxID=2478915 RepID=A0A3L7JTT7_9BACI|nr:YolD-like family protein [Falsibacillus albus]RLQ94263.1 hypothetical protein D9X91_14470 [Falsibacillus albus]